MRPTRESCLQKIRTWLDNTLQTYEQQTDDWRRNMDPQHPWGFSPPWHPVTTALCEAFLAEEDGSEELAARAASRLAAYTQFADAYPESARAARAEYRNGFPPLPNFFILPYYAETCARLKTLVPFFEEQAIRTVIARSADFLFTFPEWGAHNRATLRAWALSACARACPDHPNASTWEQMARHLAEDSLRSWNIEDATQYHGLWTRSLIAYADIVGEPNFFREPTIRYSFDYYLNLICPIGGLADFGDSDWAAGIHLFYACFERAAREYRDPFFRWAACELHQRFCKQQIPSPSVDPGVWLHALLWMDEDVPPQRPNWNSREVLEELAGKKIVFRSGWEPGSTFLLLNYKPETDSGETARTYLKHTLSVEAEKAHHGHADENAICAFTHNGSLLLHDGGYREALPNGKYRADYYHNRLVVRNGLLRETESAFTFLQTDGHYRPTQTSRIDFRTFRNVEFSRTRVTDPATGYRHDRTLIYLKPETIFVVIDAVTFLREGPFTLSNLFYTHEILDSGPGYFDTRLGSMRGYTPEGHDLALCIVQPEQDVCWRGSETARRYYRDEILLHQSTSGRGVPGAWQILYSVLIPHATGRPPAPLAAAVTLPPVSRFPKAAGLALNLNGRAITVGVKTDLEDDILWQDIRPRYTWESGRTRYGPVETDARFFYTCEQNGRLSCAWTEAARLDYAGKTVFQAPESAFPLQYSGEPVRTAVSRWRAWEEHGIAL